MVSDQGAIIRPSEGNSTREPASTNSSPWESFDDWESLIEEFCGTTDGKELLNAPLGPLLLETVSDNSGITDLILRKSKRDEIKKDLAEVKKELDEATDLLKGLLKWKVPEESPDPEEISSGSSERLLGGLLVSLNLLNRKGSEYALGNLTDLTAWDVVNRLLDELDGFPLYISGVDAKTDKGTRMALALASQAALTDPRKHYFGLAGMGYNIQDGFPGRCGDKRGRL